MPSQRIEFTNDRGERLAAIHDTPASRPARATALFAHCFTCSKNLKAVTNISRALNKAGIGVFRFDFTGLGESEGEFAATNFSTNVADLVSAANHLASSGTAPTLLIGHSLGGTAALIAASEIESIRAIVTIGSPAAANHVQHLFSAGRDALDKTGEAEVDIGGRPFTIRRQLLDDLDAQSAPERAAKLRVPLLIFHSPIDRIVGIDNATEIFQRALHPKSFMSLDQADHLLSREADSNYVGETIAVWSSRYIASDPEANTDDRGELSEATDRVTASTPATGYRTSINAHGHALLADEPASVGGTNVGPSPYGLLSAALASCTSMTLQMYARRKGWDLADANVSIVHSKVHAEDCKHCETTTGRIDRFDRHITMTGELSVEQRNRLLEIADKCPVHRTLHGEIDVRNFAD